MKLEKKNTCSLIPKLVVTPLVVFAMVQSALATEAIGDSFGYEVVGDITTNNLHCDMGTGIETSPASISDLNKLATIKGDDYGFKTDLFMYTMKKRMLDQSYNVDISGRSKVYSSVRKSNPSMTITGVMKHTRVISCDFIDVPYLKKATVMEGNSSLENKKTINFHYATTTNKTADFSTQLTTGTEKTLEVGAQVGFEFKGISGGSSVNHSSTQSSSSTQSAGQSNSAGISSTLDDSNSYTIPAGWYGYAPNATTGKQLVVTFETTFSGYVAINYSSKVQGHYYYAFDINSVLNAASESTRLTTIYNEYLSAQSPMSPFYNLYTENAENPELQRAAYILNARELARQHVERLGSEVVND
jgi:hypothetical protein